MTRPARLRPLRAFVLAVVATAGLAWAQPIEIEHVAGTLVLDEPATRVVALEWTYAEDLLAVGVQPVGVADIAGYESWVNVEPSFSDDVVDVGTRQEPSLEAILALEPDLIIGVSFRHAPILDQLQDIAPTALFSPYPGEGGPSQLDEMEVTFRTVAAAVGREDRAETVLAETEDAYDAAAARIAAAGHAGDEVLLVQAFSVQNAPQIRVFTDNAMAVGILGRLGLENAWPGTYAQYGFDTVDVEGLAPVSDADAFFYVVQADDDVFAEQLADDPIWRALGFVQRDATYALGGDTWLFGGPLSAQLVAETVADLLSE